MILTATESATPGMRLGRSVIDADGRLILAAGVTLSRRYIDMLLEQGYTTLYMADELSEVELSDVIQYETRVQVRNQVMNFIRSGAVAGSATTNTGSRGSNHRSAVSSRPATRQVGMAARINQAAELLINEVLPQQEIMIGLIDIKSMQDSTFSHSVQVALIAVVIGKSLGLNRTSLIQLGVGALLHDAGKPAVPDHIWMKPDSLTPDEIELAKTHPTAGFEFLRSSCVNLLSAHVAFQHHELMDGSGYPRGLTGNNIHQYGRIVAACDAFDTMTSERPGYRPLHPSEALAHVTRNAGTLYDPDVAAALCKVVAPYPVATRVLLSTGETAVVKQINPSRLEHPVVAVIKDQSGSFYPVPREVDLDGARDISIIDYANWYDG